jgi:branched-chain amino acid transport system substrate-binding protein
MLIKKTSLMLILVLLLVSGGIGCNPTTTPDPNQSQPVKVGAILTLSGSGEEIGKLCRRGFELGIEAANKETKGRKIEVIYEDSKTQGADGLTIYNKLVSTDGVKLTVVQSTVVASAVAPAAEQGKVLMIGTNSVQKGLAKGKNYIMRLYPDAELSADTVSGYVKSRYKRLAVFYLQNVYGQAAFQAVSQKFPGDGRQIVFSEPVAPDASDLRTLISKMLTTKPDAIFTPVYGSVSTALIRQIRERDQNIPIIGDVPLANPTVYKPLGTAGDGMVLPATPMDGGIARTPLQEQFIRDYVARFGDNPSISVAIHYDIARLLSDAIANTDGSPEAVRKYIIGQQNYNGLTAGLRFDQDGESLMELIPLRVGGGNLAAIAEAKTAGAGK